MSSQLPDEFENNENLYRAIKRDIPIQWDENAGRPSSAAFKDSNGVSVDRQWNRGHEECLVPLLEKFICRGIVHLTVEKTINLGGKPLYDAKNDNSYHSLIVKFGSNVQPELPSSVAKKLSRAAVICYENPSKLRNKE